jgi:predicted amidohydrolase
MSRIVRIAAAQVGAVHRTDARHDTLNRLILLLQEAASKGAQVVLFPECTFTTFFPRHLITDEAALEAFFEHGDITTAENTRRIFDKARELSVDISIGFAEATDEGEHYNACVYW